MDQKEMEAKLAEVGEPYLITSQGAVVTCSKCGGKVIAPGRVSVSYGGESRTFCDCITPEEFGILHREFNAYIGMLQMTEAVVH